MRDFHAARRGGLQPVQRQVWRPVDLLHNERPVRLQNTLAVAAHLGRRDRTRCPVALRPLHRRRDGNAETRCGRPAAFAGFDRIHNTFAKIIGKGSGHLMLASTPASILNHKTGLDGIPFDSVKG